MERCTPVDGGVFMLKIVRRFILLIAVTTMALCVLILRGMLPFNAPSSVVLLAGVVAGVTALAALAMEMQRAVYHPEPEDPPISDKVILPREPEHDEPFKPVTPVAPPRKPISTDEMIERVTKAVEAAEGYTHKANGRVRISLEMDEEDEQQDD
jgi:hypothetical protein